LEQEVSDENEEFKRLQKRLQVVHADIRTVHEIEQEFYDLLITLPDWQQAMILAFQPISSGIRQ
jgi:hypothetical protein